MKKILFLLIFVGIPLHDCLAGAQRNPRDTSVRRKPVSGNAVKQTPSAPKDTAGYRNPVYENGIKSAEYQNRGAEDRRNPHSNDPNAVPVKSVPEKKVLPPDPIK